MRSLFVVVVVALLVAACSGTNPASPSLPSAPAPVSARPAGSADPCVFAVTHLGAFNARLANNLAAIRPLVLRKVFVASDASSAVVQVSATLTAYKGHLVAAMEACGRTADLVPRVARLMADAERFLAPARAGSIQDARTQRGAAVALFGLLPEVLALSEAGQLLASELRLSAQVAQLAPGADAPLGSLPPLPTATPAPTPQPRPQPTPTRTDSTGTTSSGSGSTTTDWTIRANAYLDHTVSTYRLVTSNALELYGLSVTTPGLTEAETAARQEAAALYWKPAVAAIKRHLAYMSNRPARSCYKDAYAADRRLANQWLEALQMGVYPSEHTPSDRYAKQVFNAALDQTNTFLGRLRSYFSDCP